MLTLSSSLGSYHGHSMNHIPLNAHFGSTLTGLLFSTVFSLTLQNLLRSSCSPSQPLASDKSSITASASSASKFTARLTLNRSSTSQFLLLCSSFASIISLCYLLEHHPPHPHISKHYDRDWFLTILLFLLLSSLSTLKLNLDSKKNVVDDVLNRNQTEEWKGWMQAIFLLYHYYSAAETYNCVRVLITCYVWLTGFGNFSFFYLKADYSAVRMMQMMFRLNWTVLWLCLGMGNTWVLYYICPLHTFFFLMVYGVMGGIRYKMILLSVAIYLIWDTTLPIFSTLHFLLPITPAIGATNGTLWEWYFRTSLDHWSTFLGMLFALNYPVLTCWFDKVESLNLNNQIIIKTALAVPIALIFFWWVTGPYQYDKLDYNATNAYFGIIPLLTYIYFRNVSKTMRGYTMSLLHEIGKTTLETYLLQHHLWLSSNAKSLVVFVPNYPKINFCVVTCVYFAASRKTYRLTMELRGMLLPDDLNYCLKSMATMGGVLAAFGVLSAIVTGGGASSPGAWTVIVLGLIMGITIDILKEKRLQVKEPQVYKAPMNLPAFFPQAATVVLGLLTAATFDVYSHHSASPIAPLPWTCQPFADKGAWADVHCGEGNTFSAQRENKLSGLVGCGGMAWGWEEIEEPHYCRFEERNTKNARFSLRDRHVAYVGDSHMRMQYYYLLDLLGDVNSKQEDAPYHADIPVVSIGSTLISFFWKPFVEDQIEFLTSIKDTNEFDAVVAGAGQWDCNKKGDYDGYKDGIEDIGRLLAEIRRRSPDTGLLWMTPPFVNDARLPDEKKETMPESKVSKYRNVQNKILQPLYGLDLFLEAGALTKPRAKDSYDGVHYPEDVYRVMLQIEMQSFDWAFRRKIPPPPSNGNSPGTMANPVLGLFVVLASAVGIVFFDSFMGLSYLPSLFFDGPKPSVLQVPAFEKLHSSLSHLKSTRRSEELNDEEEGVALVSVEDKKEEAGAEEARVI
ncbi:hypothetical protein TL16_g04069 [Triparma laevis f. inornata]|uniref:Cas1p 10 TM acyl transferase domain-containing protein n=1 Tax=Triparma laevis f. inornata TaxID=1714386 RepID=A0A9W7E1T3_9STRA|nr:hypothetical protein TL16_g04069 [Triparma laevis f. inornata]